MEIETRFISDLAKETLQKLKKNIDKDSWTLYSSKKSLQVYHLPNSSPLMIKGELLLENVDAFEFARVLLSFECRKECTLYS